MAWQDARALHVFVPADQHHANWVEQILGTVVRPLDDDFGDSIRWLWVTRYAEPIEVARRDDVGKYTKNHPIPNTHVTEEQTVRYITFRVFRLSAEQEVKQEIEKKAVELAQDAGYWVVPWVDFDVTSDKQLGSDRFIHKEADSEKRAARARLVVSFVDATIRLMLHSLVEEDGQWKLERNTHGENPDGSFFQSIHHLFCNATNVPLSVQVLIAASPYLTWKGKARVQF